MLRRAMPLLLVAAGAVPAWLVASSVTIPHAFSDGTVASAEEVNANFAAVKAAVDDNDARIGGTVVQCNPGTWNGTTSTSTGFVEICRKTIEVTRPSILTATVSGHINAPNSQQCTVGLRIDDDLPTHAINCGTQDCQGLHGQYGVILSHQPQWVPASMTRYKQLAPGTHTVSYYLRSSVNSQACQFNGSGLWGMLLPD